MKFRTKVELGGKTATASGLAAGDDVDVRVELDTGPRIVDVPDDLRKALSKDAAAKKPETRERRLAKTLEMLRSP